jgi:hypothetical protein
MMTFLKSASRPRKAPQVVLGLSWEGRRIEGSLLRRTPSGLQKAAAFQAELSVDIDSGDPETIGRELRSQLDQAGIRERMCAVVVPVSSLLVTQTEIPVLPEADAQSLLQLEAEKGFHADPASLQIADSRCARGESAQWVTLAALPQARLAALERWTTAARLKLVSVSTTLCELQPAVDPSSEGVVALHLGSGPGPVTLQVSAGGGILALRSFEGIAEDGSGQSALHADSVAREVRITLGQLPEPWNGSIRKVLIFGPQALAESLAGALSSRWAISGFRVEVRSPELPGLPASPTAAVSAVLAARVLSARPAPLEFLPPKPSAVRMFLARHAQGPRRTVWTVAGAVAALAALAFVVQQVQLSLLESRWSGLAAKVRELERIQQDLRQFRPWTPEAARGLAILEALSSAFPENGSVTAKVVEIRESGEVVCSGTATDSPAFLAMTARLSALPGVSKVHHDQSRGASPMQFNLTFVWNGGTAR